MPRLLVGLRHSALTIELRRQGFDVIDVRDAGPAGPADDMAHVAPSEVDAVLTDAHALGERGGVREQLVSRARGIPLVVLAAAGEWEHVRGSDLPPDVLVVESPVSAAELAASIRERLPVVEEPSPIRDHVGLRVVADQEELPDEPSPGPDRNPTGVPPAAGAASPRDLVGAMEVVLGRAADLRALDMVASDVVAALATACDADALALLVPDERQHVVLAGRGLRPLEARLTVPADCWLAGQLTSVGPVLLVEDTDRHRAELACVPVARHRHLLALSWSAPDLLLLAGRSNPPFARADVVGVLSTMPTVAGRLADALSLRDLARTLAPFV
ncbi:MAG: hypothetical protein ACTHOD_18415 [Motilibacteraceae bacterium]